MLVDIVSDLAGVEFDVIRDGGQLESVRSAWDGGVPRKRCMHTTSRNTKSSADILGG